MPNPVRCEKEGHVTRFKLARVVNETRAHERARTNSVNCEHTSWACFLATSYQTPGSRFWFEGPLQELPLSKISGTGHELVTSSQKAMLARGGPDQANHRWDDYNNKVCCRASMSGWRLKPPKQDMCGRKVRAGSGSCLGFEFWIGSFQGAST